MLQLTVFKKTSNPVYPFGVGRCPRFRTFNDVAMPVGPCRNFDLGLVVARLKPPARRAIGADDLAADPIARLKQADSVQRTCIAGDRQEHDEEQVFS